MADAEKCNALFVRIQDRLEEFRHLIEDYEQIVWKNQNEPPGDGSFKGKEKTWIRHRDQATALRKMLKLPKSSNDYEENMH